jgi:tetratricopeptide (TPR) repeat protein
MTSAEHGQPRLTSHRELSPPHDNALVGRASEMQSLQSLLDRVDGGGGSAVLIKGAAGMGKTRLVTELAVRAAARGLRVIDARALEPEMASPFAVALQLFEPALASSADTSGLFDGAAGLARPLFSGDYTNVAAGSPFPLQHGLFWLAVRFARTVPVLICVDDLQWCDDASLGFVRYLERRVEDLPIVLVVATRPTASGTNDVLAAIDASWSGTRIELTRLAVEEVTSMVRARLPDADDGFCVACADVARGNPFYVREVLRSVSAERLEPTTAYSERLREVGFASISRAALFRLARLGPDPIELGRALAVLGDGAPPRRAATLAGLTSARAAAAADALVAEGLTVAGNTLSFAHPLIGQLLREDLPAGLYALMHGRAARLLWVEEAAPEAVAVHLMQTPADGDQWVVAALRSAAGRARATGVPVSAVSLLTRALDEPPTAEERWAVLAELGDAESAAGLAASVDHLRQALDLTSTAAEREQVQRRLARALASHGSHREAAIILEQALDKADDAEQSVPLLTEYLVNAIFEPKLRQGAIARTVAVLQAPPAGDTPAERALLAAMAMRCGQDCAPAANTIDLADRAWADGKLLEEQGPDGAGWLMTVWSLELASEHRRGESVALAAVRAAQSTGSMEAYATASYFCAWARTAMGRVVEAQADLVQAVAASEIGWRRYLVAALSLQSILHVARGDLDAATKTLARATEQDSGGGMEVAWRLQAAGQLAMARHDMVSALHLFTDAGAWLADNLGVDYTVLSWRTDAARAALALGDLDRAGELVDHEQSLAQHTGAPGHLGRVLRVRGLITGGEEGIALLRRASELHAVADQAIERAETLTDLGAALRRQGARARARPHLAEALEVMLRAGADGLASCRPAALAATPNTCPAPPHSHPANSESRTSPQTASPTRRSRKPYSSRRKLSSTTYATSTKSLRSPDGPNSSPR